MRRRLSIDEFNSARGATGIAAACVQNVDLRVLLDSEDKALVVGDVKRSIASQLSVWA